MAIAPPNQNELDLSTMLKDFRLAKGVSIIEEKKTLSISTIAITKAPLPSSAGDK